MDEDRTEDLQELSATLDVTADATRPPTDGGAHEAPPAAPGDTIAGRYLLIEILGQGGFGWVFRARDLHLDREVALKLLRATAAAHGSAADSLVKEGKALARLEHPNIVPVYDAGLVDGMPYLIMGLVPGQPLANRLRDGGRIPLEESVAILGQVCDALDYAHERGIVHGDIKPANLLVDDAGRVRVVDFGIARFRHEERGGAPGISGTLGYMSPEVLQGQPAGPRSDQFAVASMFYEMLAGQRAFQGKTGKELVEKAIHGTPAPLDSVCSGLPRGIAAAVDHALQKAPDRRFPDCRSFAADIGRVRRRRVLGFVAAAVVGIALVGGIAGGAVWWTRPLAIDMQLMGEKATASGEFTEVALENDAVLESGDRFWVAGLTPNRDAWVYVLLLDSSGTLAQLFPADGIDLALPLRRGQSYDVPPDLRWALDYRRGAETIFVAASREPVAPPELDALIAGVNTSGDLIADSGVDRSRGVDGLVGPAARRTSLERSVEDVLQEHFAALSTISVRHD